MSDRPAPIHLGSLACIRVHRGPRADGRWYWRADRPDGHSGREHIWSGWGSPEEAQAAVVKELGGATRAEPSSHGTVRELLETWSAAIDERSDLAERTRSTYEDTVNRIVVVIGTVLLERLNRLTIERYRDQRLRTGAASTVRLDLSTLTAAWDWGREVGLCPDRDLPSVHVQHRPDERVRPHYTPETEEAMRVLDELLPGEAGTVEGRRPLWYSRCAWLLLATGCRIGEVADLRRRQLGLTKGRGVLHVVDSKTGPRDVPLHDEALAELETWGLPEHPDARVWRVSPTTVTSRLPVVLRDACARAGVEHWSPHGFRRHAVDALYGLGERPDAAAAALGHSPEVAMRTYRKVKGADVRAAMERAQLGALPRANVTRLKFAEDE